MQVTRSAGASAALLLQRLLKSDDVKSSSPQQELQGARQTMPVGPSGSPAKCSGSGAAQMSGSTMSGAISLQMDAPATSATAAAKPTGEDIAASLVDSLDTDGDGEVSADEINVAFKAAGIETANASTVTDAVKTLDTDGSGSLSTAELGTAIDAGMKAHKGHHHGGGEGAPPPGGPPPSAGDAASSLISSLDDDEDSSLTLAELMKGLGRTGASDSETSAFALMDANGDGSLDASELTSAITSMMQKDMASYAQNAYSQSASISV